MIEQKEKKIKNIHLSSDVLRHSEHSEFLVLLFGTRLCVCVCVSVQTPDEGQESHFLFER